MLRRTASNPSLAVEYVASDDKSVIKDQQQQRVDDNETDRVRIRKMSAPSTIEPTRRRHSHAQLKHQHRSLPNSFGSSGDRKRQRSVCYYYNYNYDNVVVVGSTHCLLPDCYNRVANKPTE